MKLAYFIKKDSLRTDARVTSLLEDFARSGCEVYPVRTSSEVTPGTDMLLSLGGDGTFLDASRIAVPSGIPVAGVNFGRLGFLSGYNPEDVAKALLSDQYSVEHRTLLSAGIAGESSDIPFALNEISVSRTGAAMLGIDVEIDGSKLPTYWADGLLVATSSGSTAYSLSVGGPICTPDSRVLIVAPVAPHNLNVRPLIIPESSQLRISMRSRQPSVTFTADNITRVIPAGSVLDIKAAPVRLGCVRPGSSTFINALRDRLLWGEDVRNSGEQS